MIITEKEKEVLTGVLGLVILVNSQLKLHGHQIDSAKEEEIVLRGVLYKIGQITFDKS